MNKLYIIYKGEVMGKIIVFASGGKGGVGKSVCTVNLAGALVNHGYKVALVDTDTGIKEQGSLGVQSVSSFSRMRNQLIEQGQDLKEIPCYPFSPEEKIHTQLKDIAKSYDFVIMDTPGSATTALRSAAPIADIIYLPINCSRDEFLPLPPVFELIRGVEDQMAGLDIDRKIDIRVLPCRIDSKWKLEKEEFYQWFNNRGLDVASISAVTIPYAKALSRTVSYGVSLHDEKNKYRASFDLLIEEILGNRKLRLERKA
jgi:cellulose biosynthesis protein BcsQ